MKYCPTIITIAITYTVPIDIKLGFMLVLKLVSNNRQQKIEDKPLLQQATLAIAIIAKEPGLNKVSNFFLRTHMIASLGNLTLVDNKILIPNYGNLILKTVS